MTIQNKTSKQRKAIITSVLTATFLIGMTFAIPTSSAASFDLTDLKAYYTFDETSGDLVNEAANAGSVDSLGSAADGQLEAGVTQGQSGLIGNSYDFPGSSSGQIQLGTSKSQFRFLHDSPTMTWSTNIWINTTDTATSSGLFSTSGGSTSDVGMDLFYDGRPTSERIGVTLPQGILFQPNVVALQSPLNTLAADGQWHMITITHDHNLASDNMKLYVDGVFVSSATKTAITPINSNHDEVGTIGNFAGASADAFFAYDGNLDEFSIWNRILNPTEITNLYNSGNGLSLSAPPAITCNGIEATIIGTSGDDVLDGTSGDDVIAGLEGNDIINGKGGNDTICGDEGNDQLFGNGGSDTILGGADADFIEGNDGTDTIFGEDGDDIIYGKGGADTIDGGNGNDLIFGGDGADVISGGQGNDTIEGGAVGDTIFGDAGNDKLIGDAGNDNLDGGTNDPQSADICVGGTGGDTETNCELVF